MFVLCHALWNWAGGGGDGEERGSGGFGLYYGQERDKDKVLLHVALPRVLLKMHQLWNWVCGLLNSGWVLTNTYECGWVGSWMVCVVHHIIIIILYEYDGTVCKNKIQINP